MLKKIETKEEAMNLPPDAKFIIKMLNSNTAMADYGNGSVASLEAAHRYSPGDAFYYGAAISGMERLWAVAQTGDLELWLDSPGTPLEPGKPFPIERIFNLQQIELMKLAPRNDAVKGMVLAKLGVLPPEITDYAQLKDWIETTCKPKSSPVLQSKPGSSPSIDLEFNWTGREYGTCNYSHPMRGSSTGTWTVEQLQMAARNCEDFSDLLSAMASDEEDENSADEVMDGTGDSEYSDYSANDESLDNVSVELSSSGGTLARLKLFLRQHLPEVAERLRA